MMNAKESQFLLQEISSHDNFDLEGDFWVKGENLTDDDDDSEEEGEKEEEEEEEDIDYSESQEDKDDGVNEIEYENKRRHGSENHDKKKVNMRLKIREGEDGQDHLGYDGDGYKNDSSESNNENQRNYYYENDDGYTNDYPGNYLDDYPDSDNYQSNDNDEEENFYSKHGVSKFADTRTPTIVSAASNSTKSLNHRVSFACMPLITEKNICARVEEWESEAKSADSFCASISSQDVDNKSTTHLSFKDDLLNKDEGKTQVNKRGKSDSFKDNQPFRALNAGLAKMILLRKSPKTPGNISFRGKQFKKVSSSMDSPKGDIKRHMILQATEPDASISSGSVIYDTSRSGSTRRSLSIISEASENSTMSDTEQRKESESALEASLVDPKITPTALSTAGYIDSPRAAKYGSALAENGSQSMPLTKASLSMSKWPPLDKTVPGGGNRGTSESPKPPRGRTTAQAERNSASRGMSESPSLLTTTNPVSNHSGSNEESQSHLTRPLLNRAVTTVTSPWQQGGKDNTH